MFRIEPYSKLLYTPLGLAQCDLIYVSDNPDDASSYHCWQDETNEVWWWEQPYVRQVESLSAGTHGNHTMIRLSDELLMTYHRHFLRHTRSPFYEQACKLQLGS